MNATTKTEPQRLYEATGQRIDALLERLASARQAHAAEAACRPENYAYCGDLAAFEERLEEALGRIGG